jgi:hypothetical protein
MLPPTLSNLHFNFELSRIELALISQDTPYSDCTWELPRLKSFSITNVWHEFLHIQNILEKCNETLQHLTLDYLSENEVDKFHRLLLEGFPSLQSLVSRKSDLTNDTLALVAQNCPRLSYLDISDGRAVTGSGIKHIVAGLKNTIKTINLNSCEKVSPDTVLWARENGILVHFKHAQNTGKGRKLIQ